VKSDYLRLGSHSAAWSYTDKIISIDAVKNERISIDLRLNAFIIQLPYGLLNDLRGSLVTSSECDEQENCRGDAS
jgi:hypothetical protein